MNAPARPKPLPWDELKRRLDENQSFNMMRGTPYYRDAVYEQFSREEYARRYAAIRSDVAWSLVGVVTWSIQSQALLVLVAAIAGPAAYAPIAAGMVLLSPLRPAIWALINVARPKFAVALAEIVHGQDVGVVQVGHRLRLAQEPLREARRAGDGRREQFQRGLAAKRGVLDWISAPWRRLDGKGRRTQQRHS